MEPSRPPATEGQLIRSALGLKWSCLSPATRKRFETDPDTTVFYEGVMSEVRCSPLGRLIALLGRCLGSPLIPHSGRDIPIHVMVYKKPGHPDIFKKRIYDFLGKQPFTVETRMRTDDDGRFVEYAGLGLGMIMELSVEEGGLYFHGRGYVWDTPLGRVPVPAWLSPGLAHVEHRDGEPGSFRVRIEMRHPWFGVTFVQDGVFQEGHA
ncbi:MAG: DUF4166 domain-containing protein [Alphaproteobacteria bacterium]|nr:DUF4166 domain-containing protein [Alphaproteobacteria bacterium]